MSELSFLILDVFSRRRYHGNPLAVVMGADALAPAQLQRVAQEFNLSETVFPVAATQDDCAMRLRIFTPRAELPFAGHPIVGAACALAELGLVPPGSQARLHLQTGVGAVPVTIRNGADGLCAELLTAQPPQFGPSLDDRQHLAAVLGLAVTDLGNAEPARVAGCGLPFLLLALRGPECLAGIEVDWGALPQLLRSCAAYGLYVYALGYEGELRCRMFAPDIGEDPATGSAAAALGARLAQDRIDQGRAGPDGWRWTVAQGLEMGRPSRIEIGARVHEGAVAAISVGGHAVVTMSGSLHVD